MSWSPYLSIVHRWSILLFACFAAVALSFPLCDGDIWWHLAAGREMLARAGWLRTDPFCASSLGAAWTDLHWGFQLVVYFVFKVFGPWGLVGSRIALVATAFLVATGRRWAWDTAILAILLVFASRTYLEMRPLLLTLLGLSILLRILDRPGRIWTVPAVLAIQVALSNVQGLFLLGPLFAGAISVGAWIEGRRSDAVRLAGLGCGMIAVSVLNPWGTAGFDLAGRVASRIVPLASNPFSTEIPENQPFLSWLQEDPFRGIPWLWALTGTWLLRRSGRGFHGRWLLVAATAVLSCMAVRNLPLLALAILNCIEPKVWTRWAWVKAVAFALPVLLAIPIALERRWDLPGSAISPVAWPSPSILREVAATDGPVFHELRAGGWLAWNLPDRGACWADTRLVLHDAVFVGEYLDVVDHPRRFDGWARSRGFRSALLPVASWPRHRPLVAHLLTDSGWKLAACDGAWALFERRVAGDSAPGPGHGVVQAAARREFGSNPRLEGYLIRNWTEIAGEGGGS